MMFTLMRYDGSFRTLKMFLPLCAAMGLFFGFVLRGGVDEGAHKIRLTPILALVYMWCVLLPLKNGYHLNLRGDDFSRALPVSNRTLIASRFLSLLLLGWLPAITTTAVGLFMIPWGEASAPSLQAMLSTGMIWSAFVCLSFAYRPASPALSLPIRLFLVLSMACAIMGELFLLHEGAGHDPSFVPGYFFRLVFWSSIAAAAGALAWRSTPVRYTREPDADLAMAAITARASTSKSPNTASIKWPGLPCRMMMQDSKYYAPFLAILAFFGWGVADKGQLLLMFYMLPMMLTLWMYRSGLYLHFLDHLPISRRRLAPWALLTPLLALVSGVLLDHLFRAQRSAAIPSEQVINVVAGCLLSDCSCTDRELVVPGKLWRITTDLAPQDIEGPAGEIARVESLQPVQGLPWAVFNPYAIAGDSSDEFIAWQLSRALRAGYGADIPATELLSGSLGVVDGQSFGPRFLEQHPELDQASLVHINSIPLGLLFCVLIWLPVALWSTEPRIPSTGPHAKWRNRIRKWFWPGVMYLLFMGVITTKIFIADSPEPYDLLSNGLLYLAGGNPWLAACIGPLLAVPCYLLLARRFEHMELPMGRKLPRARHA